MNKRTIVCTAALLLLSSCWNDKKCDIQPDVQEPATPQEEGFLRRERPEDTNFATHQEEDLNSIPIRM